MKRKLICPYCLRFAKLTTGETIYPHREDLAKKRFWWCRPCMAWVGIHENSRDNAPLGTLANSQLRHARQKVHALFDPLWQSGEKTRSEAYAWLAKLLRRPPRSVHIGEMNLEQCAEAVRKMKEVGLVPPQEP
jgi:hypothetical protein